MSRKAVAGVVVLVVEAALAVLGGLVAYGLTAEYVDINATRAEAFGTAMEIGVIGLVLAGAAGLVAALVAQDAKVTAFAAGIPVLLLVALWVTGPLAVQQKLEQQPAELAARFPYLLEVVAELATAGYDYDAEFETGLDLILDGVEKLRPEWVGGSSVG